MHNKQAQPIPRIYDNEAEREREQQQREENAADFEFISMMKNFLRERGVQCD